MRRTIVGAVALLCCAAFCRSANDENGGLSVRFRDDHGILKVDAGVQELPRSALLGVNYQPTEDSRHISYYTAGHMVELLAPLLDPEDSVLKRLGQLRRGQG